jgi:hypothetical protein
MNIDLLRIARAFAAASRVQDLQLLLKMRMHHAAYGKLGDTNIQLLRDMENRLPLEIQKFDNFFFDREKAAVDKYIEVITKEKETNDNDNDSSTNKKDKKNKQEG